MDRGCSVSNKITLWSDTQMSPRTKLLSKRPKERTKLKESIKCKQSVANILIGQQTGILKSLEIKSLSYLDMTTERS